MKFWGMVAEQFYKTVTDTLRRFDENRHLIFSDKYQGDVGYCNSFYEEDVFEGYKYLPIFRAANKYCDALSFSKYQDWVWMYDNTEQDHFLVELDSIQNYLYQDNLTYDMHDSLPTPFIISEFGYASNTAKFWGDENSWKRWPEREVETLELRGNNYVSKIGKSMKHKFPTGDPSPNDSTSYIVGFNWYRMYDTRFNWGPGDGLGMPFGSPCSVATNYGLIDTQWDSLYSLTLVDTMAAINDSVIKYLNSEEEDFDW